MAGSIKDITAEDDFNVFDFERALILSKLLLEGSILQCYIRSAENKEYIDGEINTPGKEYKEGCSVPYRIECKEGWSKVTPMLADVLVGNTGLGGWYREYISEGWATYIHGGWNKFAMEETEEKSGRWDESNGWCRYGYIEDIMGTANVSISPEGEISFIGNKATMYSRIKEIESNLFP